MPSSFTGNTKVIVFPRAQMTAQEFALLLETCMTSESGIIYGCGISISGSVVVIEEGWCIIRGRMVHIDSGELSIALATSGTEIRYIVLEVDLSNDDSPADIYDSTSIPTDDDNFNVVNGTAYLILGQVTVSSTEISDAISTDKIIPTYEMSHNIWVSTEDPLISQGNNGDVWFKYVADTESP